MINKLFTLYNKICYLCGRRREKVLPQILEKFFLLLYQMQRSLRYPLSSRFYVNLVNTSTVINLDVKMDSSPT